MDDCRRQARAVELRRAGMSRAQISEAMGGVSQKMLTKWLKGVPPPTWTKRPRAKDHLREKAVALRLEGRSYWEIQQLVPVSKSSLSLWLRDVAIADEHKQALQLRRTPGSQRRADAVRAGRIRRARDISEKAKAQVPPMDHCGLFIAGVVAYWAEGTKHKPWRSGGSVIFTNSDAEMITLFLRWLVLLGIGSDRVTFRLQIHESADVAAALRHWSQVVGAPVEAFGNTTVKRHNPKTIRKNTGDGYHGCLAVRVRRSTDLNRQIQGWWQGIVAGSQELDITALIS